MDSLDALLKASGLLIPLLWKEGVDRIAGRRSGKRIQYVVWHDGQSGVLNPRLRKVKAFLSHWASRAEDAGAETSSTRVAQVFLWNSGTEDLSEEDFFRGNPLFVDVTGGAVISHRVILQTDDLGRVSISQAVRTPVHPVKDRSAPVVTLEFEHWPPGAGLVIEVHYESDTGRAGQLRLGGPVRSLRERAYLGTLWRIDLNQRSGLKAQLGSTRLLTWLSGLGFLAVLTLLLENIHTWTIASSAYWSTLLMAVSLEWVFIVWNEKRIQLTKKVSRPLAYWLDGPQHV